jgi:conjugative transfer region protein (TIGR03750 family)
MILHEINHKMAIYKDCTLGEMLLVGAMVFITETISLSILTRLMFGYASVGMAFTFISFFHITQLLLNQLQKIKYGKPQGYYKQRIVKKLAELKLIRSLYITRLGKWSVRRMS